MEFEKIEPIIFALLFASGDAMLLDVLADLLERDKDILKIEMDSIIEDLQKKKSGIIIKKVNDTYQMASNPEYFDYTKKLFEPRQKQGLSQATLEVLAIVAYNQGITRAEIEKIRGVGSDNGISALLERNLIKDAGRLDAPGRPIMYETTDEFLRCFGYVTLHDLPVLKEKEENNDNK